MSPQETEALRQLGATFQVEALGQGDPNLGINLLATMAGVLADLAPTDGTILTKDGQPARLGMNLLVTGSASASLVSEEVLTEVVSRQAHLWQHLQRYAAWIEEQRAKPGTELPPMGPTSNGAEDTFAETQNELDPLFCTRAEGWSRVLREAPAEQLPHLITRTKFLISAVRPGMLEEQLQGLRPGHPLVHVGCTQPKDLAGFSELGAALIEGRYPLASGHEMVRGNVLITDPMQMLQKVAKDADERTAWLGHFLWLCDGGAGPEAPAYQGEPAGRPETTTEHFRGALDAVITGRINLHEKKHVQLKLQTRKAKFRMRAFLTDMEPRLPGISGAAGRLIDSLAFGLEQMAGIAKCISFSIEGVEALARFLVARMFNARTMILHAAALARRRDQIMRIYRKLSKGPTDYRAIYRNLTLSVEDCDGCLHWLTKAGVARNLKEEEQWELVENARLNFDDCSTPLLEI